jgi:hypothetical protein
MHIYINNLFFIFFKKVQLIRFVAISIDTWYIFRLQRKKGKLVFP